MEQQASIATAVEKLADEEMAEESGYVDLLGQWNDAFFSMDVWQDTIVTSLTPDADTAHVKVTRTTDQLFLLEALEAPKAGAKVLSALTVRAGPARIAPKAAATVVGTSQLQTDAWVHGWDEHPSSWPGLCSNPLESDQAGILTADAANVSMAPGSSVYGYPPTEEDGGMTVAALEELGDVSYSTLTSYANQTLGNGGGPWSGTPGPAFGGPTGCNTTLGTNWGDPYEPGSDCGSYFPIIHVQGDLNLNSGSRGQGILLVDGNAIIGPNSVFLGIIVVKGTLTLNTTTMTIKGAVFANDLVVNATGASHYQLRFSSCAIERAQESLALFDVRPIESRSWVEVGQ